MRRNPCPEPACSLPDGERAKRQTGIAVECAEPGPRMEIAELDRLLDAIRHDDEFPPLHGAVPPGLAVAVLTLPSLPV